MSIYTDNGLTFAPYGKTIKKKQVKQDKNGKVVLTINKKKYKFDKHAGVVL